MIIDKIIYVAYCSTSKRQEVIAKTFTSVVSCQLRNKKVSINSNAISSKLQCQNIFSVVDIGRNNKAHDMATTAVFIAMLQ